MKVIFPFSYYYPEQCAGIFVVDDLMHRLAAEGDESVIYVPTPTRNVREGVEWKRKEVHCDDKMVVKRFRMYGEGKNPLLRALRYCFCELVYLHHLLCDKYDVAFIDSTPPIQGLKLPIVRLFRKCPVVYNAQDLFPDTLSGTGLAKKGGLLWKIGSWVARVTFNNTDKIIAISEDIKRTLVEEKGIPADKVVVVYNWVDSDAVVPIAKEENPLFEEFGLNREKFHVVYAGNLGNAQNINIVVDAAARLRDNENVEFVVFGSGGLESDIRARIETEGLKNLRLLPLQPVERVKYVYSLSDVCLVSCKEGLGGSAMPSKTWSILSCGRPVLANFDEGELQMILTKNQLGVFTKAGDLEGFVEAISQLAAEPEKCEKMGARGRQFILDNLTKDAGTRKYAEVLRSVCKKTL